MGVELNQSIKECVVHVLTDFPECRNSDVLLLYRVWQHYNTGNLDTQNTRSTVLKLASGELPHFESIRRTRQKIQVEMPKLQATGKVAMKRRINERKIKEAV